MKYYYRIDGLDCATCANNLARAIRKLHGVTDADIDFMKGKLFVETEQMSRELFAKIENLAEGFDDCKLSPWQGKAGTHSPNRHGEFDLKPAKKRTHVHEEHEHGMDESERNLTIVKIAVSAVLLVTAILLSRYLPDNGVGRWTSFAVYVLAYLVVGCEVLWSAVKNLSKGRVMDENFLMSLATVGAFLLKDYKEGVFVMLFYTVGELFQSLATEHSRKSIAEMLDLKVPVCHVIRGGEELNLPPEGVVPGEVIVVRPGEKIALDGKVIKGASDVDASALTGESKPVAVAEGDTVLGGSLNLTGAIEICVTKTVADGTVGKILELVENSTMNKAKTEKFISRFASWYTPVVVISALFVGVGIPLFAGDFAKWMSRALVFLVVSCPCALVLSVPLTFFAGIGAMAKKGVLVKGGNHVEALAGADVLLSDKTGTLTDGKLQVSKVLSFGVTEEEVLRCASLLEAGSIHPVARAVCTAYGKERTERADYTEEVAGYGLMGEKDGERILCGNRRMLEKFDIALPETGESGTQVFVAKEKRCIGVIVLRDEVKKEAKRAVADLRKQGIVRACMLTGDSLAFAEEVSKEVGLDECYAGLLPEGKVEKLNAERGKRGVIYVGDGINDAPVLAVADVGIAMGALGSDVAVETADVVVMDDDLRKLSFARKRAKKTVRIVYENVAFSLAVKVAVMVLSVLGYAPIGLAVFADVGVMVLAVLNAIRAMKN